jgi:hypothetical protein
MAGSNPALPTYPLQRSVRLRASATAYFSRTPASTTNRRTFTWSGWVKLGAVDTGERTLFASRDDNTAAGNFFTIAIWQNQLRIVDYASGYRLNLIPTQVQRDPSSWYHILVSVDTTQVTSSDRAKVYVNGVQVTAFGTATYPSQNTDLYMNVASQPLSLGARPQGSGQVFYFDGYLTEVNFIDGQALTPSSFGAYNSYGVWSPAKYTGTYGTNGFYLNFQDNSALTTTANIGIGKDSSGNGNYWTSNNISITAGVTYDSMLDVPTNTSTTNANYAVMNPLIPSASSFITSGNLNIAGLGVTNQVQSTFAVTSGKWYWEIALTNDGAYAIVGVSSQADLTSPYYPGSSSTSYGYDGLTGNKYNNGAASAYGATYASNNIISVALDMDNGKIWFAKDGVWQASGDPAAGTNAAFTTLSNTVSTVASYGRRSATVANPSGSINFGQRPFTYTPPTGYNRLCTYNLPDSIVPVGAQYMAATTYTGNGSTQAITNTVNGKSFQPDLVWIKARSVAYNNYLEDSVRGVGKDLSSNLTDAEATYNLLTAFNSNGFTAFTNGTYLASNQNGTTYVAWQWRASNASAVTNTAGTITSQVSANQTAGFSIVTYTGTGVNKATVGHSLGVFPSMIILKNRSAGVALYDEWWVWTVNNPVNRVLKLNATDALISTTAVIAPASTPNTSTTFTIGGDTGDDVNLSNKSGSNYVAYCFAPVPGYSKVGSYTGNGSADGPFVYLGFRPRFILFKPTSAGNWFIRDTSRDTYNAVTLSLYPNLSDAEFSGAALDILSNGFKPRSSGSGINGSGENIIYAAFAENPFKNALAR